MTKKLDNMRLTIFIISLLLNLNVIFGQTVILQIEKDEYKFEETIKVIIKMDFDTGLAKQPRFEGVKIVSGPNISSTKSLHDGIKTETTTWTYILRPTQSGLITIETPKILVNGKEIQEQIKTIKITDSHLTEAEKQELKFKWFVEDHYKPEGTLRYIFNNENGYIEVFKDSKWQFDRKLTRKELKILSKIH
ncbi:MAG: BatD family protein [Flavobacteriaceae bacterium]|nr:BatD family protein [Flavobacteriaceae bacterium]